MKVIIGSTSKQLGDSIASGLNAQLLPTQVSRFTDGEVNVEVSNNIHNQEVYVVQSLSSPVNDNLMELLLTIN